MFAASDLRTQAQQDEEENTNCGPLRVMPTRRHDLDCPECRFGTVVLKDIDQHGRVIARCIDCGLVISGMEKLIKIGWVPPKQIDRRKR